jgi:hypothetical protein
MENLKRPLLALHIKDKALASRFCVLPCSGLSLPAYHRARRALRTHRARRHRASLLPWRTSSSRPPSPSDAKVRSSRILEPCRRVDSDSLRPPPVALARSRRSSTPLTGFLLPATSSGRVQGRRGAAGHRGDRRRPAQGVRGPDKDRLHVALPQ